MEDTYAEIGTAENKQTHIVKEKGTIVWESIVEGETKVFSLSDVYYIPEFSNLISVGQLRAKGARVAFHDEGADLITKDGVVFAKAMDYKRNLYKMEAAVVYLDQANGVIPREEDTVMTWHRRLGHVSARYLDELRKKDIIQCSKELSNRHVSRAQRGRNHESLLPIQPTSPLLP